MIPETLTKVNTPTRNPDISHATQTISLRDLQDQHDLLEVFQRATGETPVRRGNSWRAACPFHESGDMNFAIFDGYHGQRWRCHSQCNEGGDVADFVGRLLHGQQWLIRGQHTEDQVKAILAWLGEERDDKRKIRRAQPVDQPLLCTPEDVSRWHVAGRDEAYTYWVEQRGIKESAIDQFALGYDPTVHRFTIPTFTQRKLVAVQRRMEPELHRRMTEQRERDLAAARQRFPNVESISQLERCAMENGMQMQSEVPKYHAVVGSKPDFFNWDRAIAAGGGRVLFVEGQANAMAGWANASLPAVSQTLGAGSITDAMIRKLQTIPWIYVCFDPDNAGHQATRLVSERIRRTQIIPWPEGASDFDEAIVNGAGDYFKERMGIARAQSMWRGLDMIAA